MTSRFIPLDPPPDGLSSVLVEGRRRRRRRTAATSTVAVTAVAGVLALTVMTPGGSTDSLRPMPAAPGVLPTASPSAAGLLPSPSPLAGTPQPTATGQVTATTGAAPSPTASGPPTSSEPSPAPQPAPGGYRTPDLVRTYAGPPARASLCGADYDNDPSTAQVDWCVLITAERTAEGADLVVDVCRDGTTSGRLSYDSDHEVDLAVLEDGRTLWQWSIGRSPVADSHELAAEPSGCWSWRAPWTGVDQRGQRLAGGSYVLRARSIADELADVPPEDTEFTL